MQHDPTYVRGMERLVGVVQDLSRAHTLEDVRRIVRTAARQLTGADGATLVLRDGDECDYADEDLVAPPGNGLRVSLSACMSGWTLLNRRSAVIEDVDADGRIPADAYRPTLVKSLVVVPIGRSEPVGAIESYWATRRTPTEVEVRLLQALADSTSIAMENVQAQQSLARTEDQRHQAQKMEAVGRLAGGVAHDLNNVLSVILNYAHMVAADLPPGEAMRADVEEIARAGEQAADLTQKLLAFSRQQALAPKEIDLGCVAGEAATRLRGLLGDDIELTLLPGEGVGHVQADPGQIEQVMLNLAVNARDAMPGGGRLTIEIRDAELDADDARDHLGVRPGPYVLLAVTDTGLGIDEAHVPRIFEPFLTTKERGRGTGLGLATVFGIVKQSGGHLWACSEVGRGTTFKVYLPRVGASVGAVVGAPSAPSRGGAPRGVERR